MKITFHTAFKIIMASIALIACMTAVWIPFVGILAIYATIITAGYLVVLGIPAFLILRAMGKLNGLNLALTGFLCGGIPWTILSLRSAYPQASSIEVMRILMFYGAIGLISAMVFGGVWNLLSVKQDRFPWLPGTSLSQEAAD